MVCGFSVKDCGFRGKVVIWTVFVVILCHCTVVDACGRGSIHIKNNGYRQILIAIGDNVTEDENLLTRIQEVFTTASEYLYQITRKRAFFEEIIVLVPKTWSDKVGYDPATNQTMDVSNIVVDYTDQILDEPHKPFVIRTNPCGEPGEYMQLTPEYLTNVATAQRFGAYEKVIIHEWAHLRYGVFDEYPDGFLTPEFYAAENGEIEGTRCSIALNGEFYDTIKGNRECDYKNGLPNEFCQFKDDVVKSGKFASLMYSHNLDHVDEFCDNDPDSPNTLHNRQAPTAQNRNCDGKSVWEVLRAHADFKDGLNPPRDITSTDPNFRFVKYRRKRTVIVLDTSGSMGNNNKLGKLAQAVKNYILRIALDGEEIGIVWFSSNAVIKTYLTVVNNSTRNQLVQQIPRGVSGATSIGAGLLKAMTVLSRNGQDPAGGIILLVTDGQENRAPYLNTTTTTIMSNNVIVDTLAITEDADKKIEALAKVTKGSSFYFSDNGQSNALNEAFLVMGGRGTDLSERPMLLASQSVLLRANSTYSDSIVIDTSIGRNTEFLIGHSINIVAVEVNTPSGRNITRDDPEYITDVAFKVTRIVIAGIAEKGRWTYRIQNPNQLDEPVTITVTSSVTDEKYPIVVTATWAKETVIFPDDRQILYVSVSKGLFPVLAADVVATFERPDNGSNVSPPIQLTPRDNGAGADSAKNDGIYSTFLTNFTDNGRYFVQVKVNNSPVSVVQRNRIVGTGGSGAAAGRRNRERRNAGSTQQTENFLRVTSAGSFRLENFTAGVDLYPPSKVTDLRVTVDDASEEVTLKWTATGEDLDQGTASSYVLWKSKDFDTIHNRHQESLRIDVNVKPQSVGNEEEYTTVVEETGSVTYFFALEAVDSHGNVSPRSNVVSVSLKYLNPPTNNPPTNNPPTNISLIVGCVAAGLIVLVLASVGIITILKGQMKRQQVAQMKMTEIT